MSVNNVLRMINGRTSTIIPLHVPVKPVRAVFEKRSYPHDWLQRLLENANVAVVSSDGIPLEQTLQNFGDLSVDICILFTEGRHGINFLAYAEEKVKRIRSVVPNVGIMFASDNRGQCINPNMLPIRTWLITPATTPDEVICFIEERKHALSNNSFFGHNLSRQGALPTCALKSDLPFINRALPNFNIKHPAMLLPIANVATRNNCPVFVEISPQEALIYYDYMSPSKDIYGKMNHVFKALRDDVDHVRRETGAQIFLHLDHCDDAEIIRSALECGFDSIMADGASHTLSANIRFVQAIMRMARSFGVPVEGEIGAIDLKGYRKKSTTICSELEAFVEATNVDYVGVNIRQFHGSDYGFDRARSAYTEYVARNEKKNYSTLNLLHSCVRVDTLLSNQAYPENSVERVALKALMDNLISAKEDNPFSILSNFLSGASMAVSYLVAQIESDWQKTQEDEATKTLRLIKDVIGSGMKVDDLGEKSLDLELLSSLNEKLRNARTNIVLHGGSSIKKEDLQYLSDYRVRRINFGNSPYRLFVNSLRSRAIGEYNYSDSSMNNDPLETSRFINKFASDWRTWTREAPSFLLDYQYEMESHFFKPLLNEFDR